jgi:hypothetical protein
MAMLQLIAGNTRRKNAANPSAVRQSSRHFVSELQHCCCFIYEFNTSRWRCCSPRRKMHAMQFNMGRSIHTRWFCQLQTWKGEKEEMNWGIRDTGKSRRDEGTKRVLNNAGEKWREDYRAAISKWYASLPVGSQFTGEKLREAVKKAGVDDPHHVNAWGAMARAFTHDLLHNGKIVVTPFMTSATSIRNHAHRYATYEKIQ